MQKKIISQGAEAKIILSDDFVIKDRISKSYRIPELDKKIRERRTRSEIKLLEKASKIINCPIPEISENKNSTKLKMHFIKGKKLSEYLDNFSLEKQKQILKQIGKDIAKLHAHNLIHGDLTTSNMILVEERSIFDNCKNLSSVSKSDNSSSIKTQRPKIYSSLTDYQQRVVTKSDAKQLIVSNKTPIIFFIDFGLGFQNGKYEDKSVDIHLLKQALEAKHFKNWKILFNGFLKGYKLKNKTEFEKILNQLIKVEKRGRYK